MLQSLLSRVPKSSLIQHMTGGVSQHFCFRFPITKKFPWKAALHPDLVQKPRLNAVLRGTALATVGTASYASINKMQLDKVESQRQATDAYVFLKREMNLPAEVNLDDWEQLIFVVKCAIKIKELKEQLVTVRKKEEVQLEETMASDQVLQHRADLSFHKREEEIIKELNLNLALQIAKVHMGAVDDLEQRLGDLKESAMIEQEHEVNVQKTLMAKELDQAFSKLRTDYEQMATDAEKTLSAKQKDILICGQILNENRGLVDLRNECQALEVLLLCDQRLSNNWADRLCSLDSLLETLKLPNIEDDQLAQVVKQTLPEEAVQRGVMTEVALKQRFEKVEPIAHRLALLKHEGSYNGFMYAWSYLRSMLTIRLPFSTPVPPEIALDNDNADILYKAKNLVDNGDLLSAVRLLEHLQGAPRSIVSGWLQEAHMLLQVRLATQVLKNYATMKIQRQV